jgi:hypothetical protein
MRVLLAILLLATPTQAQTRKLPRRTSQPTCPAKAPDGVGKDICLRPGLCRPKVTLRVRQTEGIKVPSCDLKLIAGAAQTMHRERSYPVSNLCFNVSTDLAKALGRTEGAERRVLYCNQLSAHPRPMPKSWEKRRPVGFANHFITYLKKDGLHYAIDGTAPKYLSTVLAGEAPVAAEVTVSRSARGLYRQLTEYYGGKEWEVRQADGQTRVGNLPDR